MKEKFCYKKRMATRIERGSWHWKILLANISKIATREIEREFITKRVAMCGWWNRESVLYIFVWDVWYTIDYYIKLKYMLRVSR